MPIEHLAYTSNGRNFRVMKDDKPTGQLCYKSQIGQENVEQDGNFYPYIKDEKAKTLTFKRSQIKLTDTGVEFYIWDKKVKDYILKTTASFHPEIKESEVWNRKTSTATNLVWEDITNDGFADSAKVSYNLSTGDMNVKVSIEVGGSARALFSFDITSKVTAEQRLLWHTDELEEAVPIQAVYIASKDKLTRTVGYRFTGYEIRWNYEEAVERKAEGIAEGQETKIIIAEKTYTPGQIARIKPDQWGETGVANTNDDCSEGSTSGVDLDGGDADGTPCGSCDWFGSVEAWDYSARFQNVTIVGSPTSVDVGTQIEFDVGYSDGSFTPVAYGLEGDTPAFNVSAPSTRTRTAASCSFTQPTAGVDRTVSGTNFQALVKEILDTSWSSGYDIGITFDNGDASGASKAFQVEDYSTGTAARLTIVYTAAGGATLSFYTKTDSKFNTPAMLLNNSRVLKSLAATQFATGGIVLNNSRTLNSSISVQFTTKDIALLNTLGFYSKADGQFATSDISAAINRTLNTKINNAFTTEAAILSLQRSLKSEPSLQFATSDIDIAISGLIEFYSKIDCTFSASDIDLAVAGIIEFFSKAECGYSTADVMMAVQRALASKAASIFTTSDIELSVGVLPLEFYTKIDCTFNASDIVLLLTKNLNSKITAQYVTADIALKALLRLYGRANCIFSTSDISLISAELGIILNTSSTSITKERTFTSITADRLAESITTDRQVFNKLV